MRRDDKRMHADGWHSYSGIKITTQGSSRNEAHDRLVKVRYKGTAGGFFKG